MMHNIAMLMIGAGASGVMFLGLRTWQVYRQAERDELKNRLNDFDKALDDLSYNTQRALSQFENKLKSLEKKGKPRK